MFQRIKQVWQGSDVVEFESAFGMDESVQRLKSATRRHSFFSMKEGAVGTVGESRVSLQRVIPMARNSFKPFFIGRFERRGGKAILIGRFKLNTFVKVFMSFWIGIVGFITVMGVLAAIQSLDKLPFALMGLGMMAFGVLLTAFGGWLARGDQAWLSAVIRDALHSPRTEQQQNSDQDTLYKRKSGKPWTLLKAALVLAILGVLSCVSAITGIQTYRASAAGSIIVRYHDPGLRYVAGVIGVTLLGLSYGIYQRKMLAWRLVFWVIGGMWIVQVGMFLLNTATPVPNAVRLLFAAIASIVMVVWGRWWYAQRSHFLE